MSVIAKLMAGIGLNTDEFKRGIGEVQGQTNTLEAAFGSLKAKIGAAFSIGAVTAWIGHVVKLANELSDLSEQSNSTVNGFQALRNAMEDGAGKAEDMDSALLLLNQKIIEAKGKNGELRKAFSDLGISMENLAGLKTDEAFALIAEKVSDADGSTQSLNAVIDIFGKKAKNLLPILQDVGTQGLDPLIERQKKLGQLMDEQFAADAEKFKTGWDKVVRVAEGATAYYISRLGKLKDAIKNTFDFTDASEKSWNPVEEFYRKWKELDQDEQQARIRRAAEEWEEKQRQREKDLADLAEEQKARAAIEAKGAEERRTAEIKDAEKRGRALLATWEAWREAKRRKEKELADAERAEADRVLEYQKTQLDGLAGAQERHSKAVWASLSAEEKHKKLLETRAALIAAISTAQTDSDANAIEGKTKILELQTDLLEIDQELKHLSVNGQKPVSEAKAEDVRVTMEQVKAIKALRKLIKNMTDAELTAFRNNLKKVHDAVAGLDFSNLNGLYALKDFELPSTSVNAAERFGQAMAAMFNAIATAPVIPDLSQLETLKGFDVAAGADVRLKKLGKALLDFVAEYNRKGIDLSPFDSLTKLVEALAGGASVSIDINAPTKEQLTLQVPSDFEESIKSIDGNLAVLAGLKGVIFK